MSEPALSGAVFRAALIGLIADNIRHDLGSEADLRALGESLRKCQLEPILLIETREGLQIVAGHRRFAAARLVGLTHLNAIKMEGEYTPEKHRLYQLTMELHRKEHSPCDISKAINAMMAANASLTGTQVAKEMGVSESLISLHRLAALLVPEVRAAYEQGRIGLSAMAKIARKPDQIAAMGHYLKSGSRDAIDGPATSTATDSAKPAQAEVTDEADTDDTTSSGRTLRLLLSTGVLVTFKGVDDLDAAIEAADIASKEITKARKADHDIAILNKLTAKKRRAKSTV